MQRHNGLVAETQTHYLLVLATVAAMITGRAIIYVLCAMPGAPRAVSRLKSCNFNFKVCPGASFGLRVAWCVVQNLWLTEMLALAAHRRGILEWPSDPHRLFHAAQMDYCRSTLSHASANRELAHNSAKSSYKRAECQTHPGGWFWKRRAGVESAALVNQSTKHFKVAILKRFIDEKLCVSLSYLPRR